MFGLCTQSEANVSGLIVSDPEVGIKSYGLTLHGQQQVIQVIVPSQSLLW